MMFKDWMLIQASNWKYEIMKELAQIREDWSLVRSLVT